MSVVSVVSPQFWSGEAGRFDDVLAFVVARFAGRVEERIDHGLHRAKVEDEDNPGAGRGLIDQIDVNTEQISLQMTAYSVISDRPSCQYDDSPRSKRELLVDAACHDQGAKALSLHSQVQWHLYAECLDRACYFMLISTEYLDPRFALKPVQQKYIEVIREFPNHMAHRDNAVLN